MMGHMMPQIPAIHKVNQQPNQVVKADCKNELITEYLTSNALMCVIYWYEYMCDEFLFWCCSWIIGIMFNIE